MGIEAIDIELHNRSFLAGWEDGHVVIAHQGREKAQAWAIGVSEKGVTKPGDAGYLIGVNEAFHEAAQGTRL